MNKTVLHFDIDAFFASVEQLRNPALKGKPVIVGAGVIASCSYEARKYGLHAGMSIAKAKKLCPKALVLEGNCQIYRCVTDRIFEICHSLSPSIETYLDEAYCDLSGTEMVYHNDIIKPAREFKERVKNEVGLSATVGLGVNRMVAKMASKSAKPFGFRAIKAGDETGFISSLPVESLPGVGRKTGAIFKKFNINTIEEIRKLPIDSLKTLFGQNGAAIYERCRGRDTHVINEREIPKSISRETTFHKETTNRDEIEGMIHYLAERAMNTLRELKLLTKAVNLKIRYSDFIEDAATRRFVEHTNIDSEVFERLMDALKIVYKRRVSLRLVGVTLSNFKMESAHEQLSLFESDKEKEKRIKLYRSVDSIRNKYGFSSIIMGQSINISRNLEQDSYGYILRTPSLTK